MKRRLRGAIAPAIFLSLVAYFAWNATQGDRGLVAHKQRLELLQAAKAELGRSEAERAMWERRVAGLRGRNIDRDALDERSRAMLNLADPADVIVPYGPKDKLF